MARSRRVACCLAVVAAVLAVIAVWLATASPTVHTASDGDYQCYAPYDIVLNDVHPTGAPNDYGQVEAACSEAAKHRFHLAVRFAVASGVVAVIAMCAAIAAWLHYRRSWNELLRRVRPEA